jgi:hypothetical protein
MSGHHWTEAETAQFRAMCADGASSRAIAEALGRSLGSIGTRRRTLGLLQSDTARTANVIAGMARVDPAVFRAIGSKAGKTGWTKERRAKARRLMKARMKRPKMQNAGNAVIAANPEIIARRTAAMVETKIGWCPLPYRDERRRLVKNFGSCAADRMIREQIAADKRRASEAEAAANGWSMKFQAELERARAGAPIIEIPRMRRAPPDYSPMGGSLNF